MANIFTMYFYFLPCWHSKPGLVGQAAVAGGGGGGCGLHPQAGMPLPYSKAGGSAVVYCTVGPFKVAASQGLLSLFCELLLCSLAQQSSAGNAI